MPTLVDPAIVDGHDVGMLQRLGTRASRRKRWSNVELRARLRIRTLSATS